MRTAALLIALCFLAGPVAADGWRIWEGKVRHVPVGISDPPPKVEKMKHKKQKKRKTRPPRNSGTILEETTTNTFIETSDFIRFRRTLGLEALARGSDDECTRTILGAEFGGGSGSISAPAPNCSLGASLKLHVQLQAAKVQCSEDADCLDFVEDVQKRATFSMKIDNSWLRLWLRGIPFVGRFF